MMISTPNQPSIPPPASTPIMMRKTALILLIAGGCLSIVLQLWFKPAPPPEPPAALKTILLPEPRPLDPFQLIDHHGEPFTIERLRGKWSFLFFGYTHCPDICPVAMGVLAEVDRQLRRLGNRAATQTLFISVDPRRDTPELLKRYLPYFNDGFLGITGDAGAILRFSRQMGAFYQIPEEAENRESYTINHTGAIFLIDPRARFTALFPHRDQEGLRIAQLFGQIIHHFDKERQE